jgi:hypothetical protein
VEWANWPIPDELWQDIDDLLSNQPEAGTAGRGRG